MINSLYAITDEKLMPGDWLRKKSEAALKGGCKILQYRNKNGSASLRLEQARQLRALCAQYDCRLIINDDLALAHRINADGVHLGQTDLPVATAAADAKSPFIIGATCHNSLAVAETAVTAGASYIAFGRFFSSTTKPTATAADVEIIGKAKKQFQLPVVAIGGITLKNCEPLLNAGVDSLAVCYDLFGSDSLNAIEQTARSYSELFN